MNDNTNNNTNPSTVSAIHPTPTPRVAETVSLSFNWRLEMEPYARYVATEAKPFAMDLAYVIFNVEQDQFEVYIATNAFVSFPPQYNREPDAIAPLRTQAHTIAEHLLRARHALLNPTHAAAG